MAEGGSGITIGLLADTKEFDTAVRRGVIKPIDDAGTALDEMAQAAQKSTEHASESFGKQQTATDKLRTHIDDLNKHIDASSKAAYGKQAEHASDAAKKTDEAFGEAKDSAKTNAISTAASFNGSFDSVAGGLQGLISEFAAGFGPAGLIAGVIGAGVIGALTTSIDDAGAATDAMKQKAYDLAAQLIDTGTKGKISFDDVKSTIEDMATDFDGSKGSIITLQKAFDDAKVAGGNYADIVQAIASNSPDQIARAKDAVDKLAKAHHDADTNAGSYVDESGRVITQTSKQSKAADALQTALGKAATQAKITGDATELAAKAGLNPLQQKADLISQLADGYDSAAGEADTYIDKESGLFDVGKYISAMHKRQQALADYATELSKANLTPEARGYIESLGADQASAMMAGYKSASPAQQAELNRLWSTAGVKNAQSYTDAVGKQINNTTIYAPPIHVPTPSKAQLARALADAQAYVDAHPLQAKAVAYAGGNTPGKPLYQ